VSVAFDNNLIKMSTREQDNYEACVQKCDWWFRCIAIMFDLIENKCYIYVDQTLDFDAMHIFTLRLSSFKNIFQAKSEKRGKQITVFSILFTTLFVLVLENVTPKTRDFKCIEGPSWLWLHGSWISHYLCNQCLSPLML